MPLLLHDTFTGSGSLDGAVPDTIGSAWALQEIWPDTSTGNADYYLANGSGRSRMIKSGGSAVPTTSMLGFSYGVFYKAGCTVPNNFDLEVKWSPAGASCQIYVIWRANLSGLSPKGKTNSWTGVYSGNNATYWRTIDGYSTNDDLMNLSGHAATAGDVVKIEVRSSVVTPYINTVVQDARTYSNMPSSGSVYIGWGCIWQNSSTSTYIGQTQTGGSIDYIKIADPGDLNYVASSFRGRVVGGGVL